MRKLLILLIFGSISLAGCGSLGSAARSMGVGRRPIIEYIPPEDFKSDEREFLLKWHGENPALWEKLQKHNNKLAKAIAVYNEESLKINITQNQLVNDGDAEAARAAVRVQIQKAKYPQGHDIYKIVNGDGTKTN